MKLTNKHLQNAQKAIEKIPNEGFSENAPQGIFCVLIDPDSNTQVITKATLTQKQIVIVLGKLTELQAELFKSIVDSKQAQ